MRATSPLPAGSLPLGGGTLLGSIQLTVDNGRTGWVRQEELIPLWRWKSFSSGLSSFSFSSLAVGLGLAKAAKETKEQTG